MAPKTIKINDAGKNCSSASSSCSISVFSDKSSLLSGSVSSAAANVPLKVSNTVVREKSIVFWTPVMLWPSGFTKVHKKQTIEYKSDSCLHNAKYPLISK